MSASTEPEVILEAINECDAGRRITAVARQYRISVSQLEKKRAAYHKTGEVAPPKRPGPEPWIRTPEFEEEVVKIKREHPNYGRDRIWIEMQKRGFQCGSSRTVFDVLNKYGLQLPSKRGPRVRGSS